MRVSSRRLALASTAFIVAGSMAAVPQAGSVEATPDPGVVGVAAGPGHLVVAGTSTPFVPRGFNSVGILYPEEYPALCDAVGLSDGERAELSDVRAAMVNDTEEQLLAMKTHWRANAVRYQVSQGALALEHHDPGPDPYTETVLDVVAQARAMGLVTVVSLQTQIRGCTPHVDGDQVKLPNDDSVAAWSQLAPTWVDDMGVVLEIFNEPQSKRPCATGVDWSWPEWAYGCDTDPATGVDGMVPLGQAVRAMAPDNLLLFDGDNNGGKFNDFTPPPDITDNTAYAIHPYFYADGPTGDGPAGGEGWDERFGHLQESGQAVVNTEWNGSASCREPELAAELVQDYLPDHQVGMFVHSWDAPAARLVDDNYDPVDSVPKCPEFTGATLAYDLFWSQAGGGDPAPEIKVGSVTMSDGAVDAVSVAIADNGSDDGSAGPLQARSVLLLVQKAGSTRSSALTSMSLDTTFAWTNGSFTIATASGLADRRIAAEAGDVLIVRVRYGDGTGDEISYPVG
ncbi:hypothetical protein E1262_18850 [Jiangella aurantiaca]|uniref:Glycoside hydrolase family 5 domain-containing protein n=1 Tax=Jiangella aurantiaca TaxID=2530373 RepID=A0A4R5A668_9ACTN|nr:cellulase family glycosylhydrolase [Jiangella aurantiaca]TDD67513.1 hypothetical protein E1262_18850 [Jiangella aurantiaca]